MVGDSLTVHSDGRTIKWSEEDERNYSKLVNPLLILIRENKTGSACQYLAGLSEEDFKFVINNAAGELLRACIDAKNTVLLKALFKVSYIQQTYHEDSSKNQSYFLAAIKKGDSPTFQVLLKNHNNPLNFKDNQAMRTAATYGWIDILLKLLKDPKVVEDIQAHDNIALKEAVRAGKLQCAAILCDFGACVGKLGYGDQQKVKDQYFQLYGKSCPENILNWATYNTCTFLFGTSPTSSPSYSPAGSPVASTSESLTDEEDDRDKDEQVYSSQRVVAGGRL